MSAAVREKLKLAAASGRVPTPVLRAVWRARERVLSWRGDGDAAGMGGPPLPPRRLRALVSGTGDARFFLESGRGQAKFIRELLARNDAEMADLGSILDFGCGCGRIARWWSDLRGPELHGCDYNEVLVRWCRRELPFMEARATGLDPALPYEDGRFDLVYAISVFTHLTEELQLPWLTELQRVLRPGGLLLFTVSGDHYAGELRDEDEAAAYSRGELVIRFDQMVGTNMCAAFHPPGYVQERMLTGWRLLDRIPGSDQDLRRTGLAQDTYLVARS